MLRKLLKYEFRASLLILPICLVAMALLYGAGWAAKAIGISQLATTCAVFLALVGCASAVVALITAILRFYKGVFGAEGYLIQTLPVGKGSIILSKAITAYVLLFAGMLMALLAILGTMQLMGAQEFFKGLNEQLGGSLVTMGVYVGVSMLIGLALTIGELYFAITLANTKTFSSNSVLFSVLFYFCTTMVAGLLEVVAMLIVPLGLRIGADGASFVFENIWGTLIESLRISGGGSSDLMNVTIGMGNLAMDLLLAAAFLVAARWLMTKKTSVK